MKPQLLALLTAVAYIIIGGGVVAGSLGMVMTVGGIILRTI